MRTAMRQIMGVFAELERAMIVQRMRKGRAATPDAGGYAMERRRSVGEPKAGSSSSTLANRL